MQQQVAQQWSKLEHVMVCYASLLISYIDIFCSIQRKKQAEEASKKTAAATVLQSAWKATR